MRDGVALATDVYLPQGTGPWPVLVARLPYDKAGDECFMPAVARWFVDRSYAVVVQDVRGKVRSAGTFVPYTNEAVDGYDTLDWAAHQPWSCGDIGMIGDSYYGFTQWAAAASAHPALRAITPRVCSTDFQSALTAGGVLQLESLVCWAAETWIDEALYDVEDRLDWSTRPLSMLISRAVGGLSSPGLDDLILNGAPPGMKVPATGHVPGLHLGGFADILLGGQLQTWREARTGSSPQYLILDHTDHGWTPLRSPHEPFNDPTTTAVAMNRFLEHYLGPLLPFLDHFVRHHGAYDEPPVRWRAGRDQTWRATTDWPPPSAQEQTWYLNGGSQSGQLSRHQPVTQEEVSWTHRPEDPVPSRIHPYYPHIAPVDESANQSREDVLSFSTEVLERGLLLAGPVRLDALLSSESVDTHLIVTLYDVFEDGSWHRITEGATHVTGPWPAPCRVQLNDAGYLVQPGHGLVVTVSSSSFPRYVLHPGTSEDPWIATTTAERQQLLWLGGPHGATLTCHVEPEEMSAR
jgi:predicted acyl esterase